jgi:geranylgeranyl transferase type-2 subunit alpha
VDSKQKEQKQIGEYQRLVKEVERKAKPQIQRKILRIVLTFMNQINGKEFTLSALALTTKLLTRNPEYYTIWNYRRRTYLEGLFPSLENLPRETPGLDLQAEALALIKDDLNFLLPLLREYPKCYWIWNHRLWLLQQYTLRLPKAKARDPWEKELQLVGKMLALDSRNFLGWGYRRTVISSLEKLPVKDQKDLSKSTDRSTSAANISLTEQELNYTTSMIYTNLSNFSAWHNRLILLPRLLLEQDASNEKRQKAWDDEIELIHTALYTDPYDSSLWAYHNSLFEMLVEGPSATTILADLSTSKNVAILEGELEVVNDLLEDTKDCKWMYEALIRLSLRLHEKRLDGTVTIDIQPVWQELLKLDPLRSGRWHEWAQQVGMTIQV